MKIKKIYIFIIFFSLLIIGNIYFNNLNINNATKIDRNIEKKTEKIAENKENLTSVNTLDNVSYSSKDLKGNEYLIFANKGEIDFSDKNIIFLTKVRAIIKLKNSNNIEIASDFGKYNANNFDTIFSKNVIVTYLDNKINSEYLDFSIDRNSMIISNEVTFTNLENTLKADVIEMNLDTKDSKIYMHKNKEKVIITNNKNGNN
tara:strand:+ start:1125 stop:1733 length:609 start_codon:yes stop_codon:yes gene_type:complete